MIGLQLWFLLNNLRFFNLFALNFVRFGHGILQQGGQCGNQNQCLFSYWYSLLSLINNRKAIMQTSKRKLRNSDTCSSVANPFYRGRQNTHNIQYLPLGIATSVSPIQHLACQQIYSFPTFHLTQSPEQGLALMKKATEWQANSIFPTTSSGQQKEECPNKVNNEMNTNHQVALTLNTTKIEHDGSIYEVLFQNELHDFIMSPYPPVQQIYHHSNYDYDHDYYRNMISPTMGYAKNHMHLNSLDL